MRMYELYSSRQDSGAPGSVKSRWRFMRSSRMNNSRSSLLIEVSKLAAKSRTSSGSAPMFNPMPTITRWVSSLVSRCSQRIPAALRPLMSRSFGHLSESASSPHAAASSPVLRIVRRSATPASAVSHSNSLSEASTMREKVSASSEESQTRPSRPRPLFWRLAHSAIPEGAVDPSPSTMWAR